MDTCKQHSCSQWKVYLGKYGVHFSSILFHDKLPDDTSIEKVIKLDNLKIM